MARPKIYLYKSSDFSNEAHYDIMEAFSSEERGEILSLINKHSNVSAIRERFPQIPKGAIDQFIPLLLSEEECENCGGTIYTPYERDINKKTLRQIGKECIDCGHNYESDCKCNSCNIKAENLWKLYLDKIFRDLLKQML